MRYPAAGGAATTLAGTGTAGSKIDYLMRAGTYTGTVTYTLTPTY